MPHIPDMVRLKHYVKSHPDPIPYHSSLLVPRFEVLRPYFEVIRRQFLDI